MSVLLQVVENAGATSPKEDSISVLELAMSGGVIMIPIALLSIIAIYLIIERFLYIGRATKINPHNMMVLKDKLKSGQVKEAAEMCRNTQSAWGRIFARGINSILAGSKISDIDAAVEDGAQVEIARMEKNMSYLNLIAGLAPILGFIGTIFGVIKIFHSISVTPDLSIGNISGGLYVKMVTSAAGLIVGLIAFAGYHMLNARIDRFAAKIEENTLTFKSVAQGIEE